MSRNIWIITLVISGSILMFGVISNINVGVKSGVESCKLMNLSMYDTCINQLAEQKGKSVCKLVEARMLDDCYLHAAIGDNRPAICQNINADWDKDECFGKVAVLNRNLKSLEYIPNKLNKERWLAKVAIRYNESNYCRLLTDVNIHGECYKTLAKNTENIDYCFAIDIGSIHKEPCFLDLAMLLHDNSICGHMNSLLKGKCMSEVGG